MNGKKARDMRNENVNKMKLVAEEEDHAKVANDMATSIAKMYEDRDKKALGARDHLVSQLEVTADKYRTANGVMSALDTVRLVAGNHTGDDLMGDIAMAKGVAIVMAHKAQDMRDKAQELDPDDMDQLCDGFYEKEFAESESLTAVDMVVELMLLQLCQNVGPAAQDVADFCRTADEEIEKARNNLRDYCEKHGLSFEEMCLPQEKTE